MVPANCLLLNLLCCALESRTSYSSNSFCVSMYQLQAPYSLGSSSLMLPSCSAMRPQQTTKLNCSGNTYHSCSLHRCLQTTTPTFMPILFTSRPTQAVYTSLSTFVKFNLHNMYIQVAIVLYSISEHTCTYHMHAPLSTRFGNILLYSCTAFSHQRFSHVHGCMHAAWCMCT